MRKTISIIGGGSCALMLACELNSKKFDIHLYEKNKTPGRKFLVAGDGGLNLTHSESESDFISRYTPNNFLKNAFQHFSNHDFIKWLNDQGVETFVGSSGRVFPKKGIKPIEVLNILTEKIKRNKVTTHVQHEWKGFLKNNALVFEHNKKFHEVKNDYVVFCLGGASWPVTGSDGNWAKYFQEKNIEINDFLASNCAFKIEWGKSLLQKVEGRILKNISTSCGGKVHLGEIVMTEFGIEGSGIYPLSTQIRERLKTQGYAEILIDFKPSVSLEKIIAKLNTPAKKNFTSHLKAQLNLSDTQISLLKHFLTKDDFLNLTVLAKHIKGFSLVITDTAPIIEAISTVGGISLNEIDENFELKKLPKHFALGEMLDYDAPTGGYLLQSCFSMGKFLANYLNNL